MRWRLSLLMFLQYAPAGAMLPMFSRHLDHLKFSPSEVAWVCATPALGNLIGSLIAGQVADRWASAERCLFVCAVASGLLLWLLAGLATPAAVFVVTLAVWLLMAPAITLGTTITLTHLADLERGYGRVRLWGTLGWVAASWMFGYWLANPSWADPLRAWLRPDSPEGQLDDSIRLAAALSFALAGYALTLPHTPPQHRLGAPLAPLAAARLLGDRNFLVFAAGSLGASLTGAVFSQVAPLRLADLGVPDRWIAPAQTVSQSTEVLSLALLPMLLTRLETRRTMLLGLAVWSASLSALTLARSVALAVPALGGWGVVVCCYLVAGQVYVNSRARGDLRTSSQALLTATNALGMLAGNVLAGWIRSATDGALPPVFAVAAGIAALVGALVLFGFWPDGARE
ncbi:MAG TPA: MFS transporter [Gemmataceae bacterium]|nr:MFS transporter [Gemmataceae bacterium]